MINYWSVEYISPFSSITWGRREERLFYDMMSYGAMCVPRKAPRNQEKTQNKIKQYPQNRASPNNPNMWECFVLFNASGH